MSKKKTYSTGNGIEIGFIGLLTIVFITLKLCHVINWSWWWVLSPLLISWGIVILIYSIIAIVMIILIGERAEM